MQVQAHFSQYFHALSEVLQSVNGNSQDLETICMDVATKQDFYERAHGCFPVLKVLGFSAELLCLLQPSHVAGLLPPVLLKALITLSGDLILAECTFGMHKNVIVRLLDFYLAYLWVSVYTLPCPGISTSRPMNTRPGSINDHSTVVAM